ncbi:MAG: hypothetical protein VKO64_03065 [Candidatus Sericytochromatia bacterium]|nr:hypothetical protein [Candidatus Sericytochromatia bacterium]
MNFLDQLKNLANKGKDEPKPAAEEGGLPAARPRKRRKQNLNPLDPKNLPALIPVAIAAIGGLVFVIYLAIQNIFFAPPPIPTDTPPPLQTPPPATDSVPAGSATGTLPVAMDASAAMDPANPVTSVATYYPPPRPISLPQAGATGQAAQPAANPAMMPASSGNQIPRLDVLYVPEQPNAPVHLASTAEELGQTDLIFWQMIPVRDIRVRVHQRQRLSTTGEAVVLIEFEDDPAAMAGRVTRKKPDNTVETYILASRDTAWVPESTTLRGAQYLNLVSPVTAARAGAVLAGWEDLIRRAVEAAALTASGSGAAQPAAGALPQRP